ERKKEGLLLVELLAGCTSTSKAAHVALKLRKQLTSNTGAAHATPRGCARIASWRQQSCLHSEQ
ncbi:hypothetical protein PIB30_103337, partial [Stylosanthes scabra]|nr:hypothetical protein [Stylosanthes scabra]